MNKSKDLKVVAIKGIKKKNFKRALGFISRQGHARIMKFGTKVYSLREHENSY